MYTITKMKDSNYINCNKYQYAHLKYFKIKINTKNVVMKALKIEN